MSEHTRTRRKRPIRRGYRFGVDWIAANDECSEDEDDPASVATLITVVLLADLFGKDPDYVAHDVVMRRRAMAEQEGRG